MKRIITCLIFCVMNLGIYAQLSEGYYRLQCKETGRYLTVHNNYVDKESAKSRGQVEFHSLQTISGFDNVVNDPGSVIYLKKTSKGYIIESQGFTTGGHNIYLQFDQRDDAYIIYTTIKYDGTDFTRYLRDYQSEDGECYITTDKSKSPNWQWYVTPVNNNDKHYLGLKGDVKVGNSYYTTFYAAFPVQLGSGMKAYAVNTLTENTCTLQDIGNVIPTKTPVVIECAGQSADANKITPISKSSANVGENKLDGVIFCYPVLINGAERRRNPYWNVKDYDPETMRLLGEADGKLAFITASDVKYLAANRAYLPVAVSSAVSILVDGTSGISRITSNPSQASQAKGTYTLNGVRLPDNITPQKGIYIKDGKKIVIK